MVKCDKRRDVGYINPEFWSSKIDSFLEPKYPRWKKVLIKKKYKDKDAVYYDNM